ncbi:MAG: hypothetical protein MZV64_52675 [Ignavibacteriales bacterium]|nr:hypothetical protein [Ignavibacteriales bacterium]
MTVDDRFPDGLLDRPPRRPHRRPRHRAPRAFKPLRRRRHRDHRPRRRARPCPGSSRATATSPASASRRPVLDLTDGPLLGRDRRHGRRGREDGASPASGSSGRGWHQEKWDRRGPSPTSRASRPTRRSSAVSPDNPVVLTHASGHADVRQRQGHGAGRRHRRTTPNPAGRRDPQGRARASRSALFRETASRACSAAQAGPHARR